MGTITRIDAINRGFRQQSGMSDQDRDNEHEAARIFYQELAAFRSAIAFRVLPRTELRKAQIQELLDIMEDFTPGPETWENSIKDARHD